jgi:hypothetical protein
MATSPDLAGVDLSHGTDLSETNVDLRTSSGDLAGMSGDDMHTGDGDMQSSRADMTGMQVDDLSSSETSDLAGTKSHHGCDYGAGGDVSFVSLLLLAAFLLVNRRRIAAR